MKKLLLILGTNFVFKAGIAIGVAGYKQEIRRKLSTLAPLLSGVITDAVENSFESGMTMGEVLDKAQEDLKFIEQVIDID